MSFRIEDIEALMVEFDIDLMELRDAILAHRKSKSIDKRTSKPIPSEKFEDLFSWEQIKLLETPWKKH